MSVNVTGRGLFFTPKFTPLTIAIAPEYLMHRLRANHHAYAYDDYNHDRAQHRRKRGRVLLAEVIHVCHPRAYTTTRR